MSNIGQRKDEHIDIVLGGTIEHSATHLLDCVVPLHQSLPELDVADVDLGCRWFGRSLAAPLLIAGMTGGSDRARRINIDLALAAERANVALGVGSMRPLLSDPARRDDYDLRPYAPRVPLLGNLGVMQAGELPPAEVGDLLRQLDYDALCIHLNPAQELAQAEGDRKFRGAVATIARYAEELELPVVVKETGAGMSPQTLDALRAIGINWVDVSGRGGTSWTKVEARRPGADRFGDIFGDWGIPTAASVVWAQRRGFRVVASGGIRSVGDVLRSLMLGADYVGMARPVLMALETGGVDAVTALLGEWIEYLRRACVLVGADSVAALRRVPRLLQAPLDAWLRLDMA